MFPLLVVKCKGSVLVFKHTQKLFFYTYKISASLAFLSSGSLCLCCERHFRLSFSLNPTDHHLTLLVTRTSLTPPETLPHGHFPPSRPAPLAPRWDSKWGKITNSATQSLHLTLCSPRARSGHFILLVSSCSLSLSLSSPHARSLFPSF